MSIYPSYAELHCISNFSFLRGASSPEELVITAAKLGYHAIALTDECSMAGVVRAHTEAKKAGIKLIIGNEFKLKNHYRLVLLARNHKGYTSLCKLISDARNKAEKGDYLIETGRFEKVDSQHCIALLIPPYYTSQYSANTDTESKTMEWFKNTFTHHWLSLTLLHSANNQEHARYVLSLAQRHNIAIVASGDVHMHARYRRALQDVVTCIREHCTLQTAGRKLATNGEQHLRTIENIASLYPCLLYTSDAADE